MPLRANKDSDLSGLTATNPVFDLDNVYLSDRGWAYRHYKREDKSLYWDEILVAGEVDESLPANAPVSTFGEANPTFEGGGGADQSPTLTIAPAVLTAPAEVEGGSAGNTFSIEIDAAVSDATYAWTLVDETGATITAGAGTDSITVTAGTDAGTYTVRCVVTSATADDSPLTVEESYEVVDPA